MQPKLFLTLSVLQPPAALHLYLVQNNRKLSPLTFHLALCITTMRLYLECTHCILLLCSTASLYCSLWQMLQLTYLLRGKTIHTNRLTLLWKILYHWRQLGLTGIHCVYRVVLLRVRSECDLSTRKPPGFFVQHRTRISQDTCKFVLAICAHHPPIQTVASTRLRCWRVQKYLSYTVIRLWSFQWEPCGENERNNYLVIL